MRWLRSQCGDAWTFVLFIGIGAISLSALGVVVAVLVTLLKGHP